MPGSCYVKASFEFANPEPGEIRLAIGDVVEVTGAVDDNWLIGRNHSQSSQVGNFPKNFAEPLELPCVKDGQKVFLAMRSFHGEMAEDLSFRKGEIIVGLSSVDASWWKGTVDERTGIFPLTFVKELISISAEDTHKSQSKSGVESISQNQSEPSSDETKSPVLPSAIGKEKPVAKARATHDLDAQLDDELSLTKDDVIEVFRMVDDVFALGRSGDKVGQFPLAFVEIFEGSLETPKEVVNDSKKKSKFDWWQDPNAEELILKKSHLGEIEPTPSFEEQTAPISAEEEYTLKTSHAYYSKPGSDSGTRPEDSLPVAGSLLVGEIPGASVEVAKGVQFVRTLFAFAPENDNELGFDAGELVALIGQVDDQWMEGELHGKRGIFPGSYVELCDGYAMQHKYTDGTIQPSVAEDVTSVHLLGKPISSPEVAKVDTVFHQTSVVDSSFTQNSTPVQPVNTVEEKKAGATLPSIAEDVTSNHVSDKPLSSPEVAEVVAVFHQTSDVVTEHEVIPTQTSVDLQPINASEEKGVPVLTENSAQSSAEQSSHGDLPTEPGIDDLSGSSRCGSAESRLEEKISLAETEMTDKSQEPISVDSDAIKSEAAKSEAAKSEATKSEAAKSEAVKSEALKSEAVKSEAVKSEAAKSEATKSEAAKSEAEKLQSTEGAPTENQHESVADVADSPLLEAAESADAILDKSAACEGRMLLKSALDKVLSELTSKLVRSESKPDGNASDSEALSVCKMQKSSPGKDLSEIKQEVVACETVVANGQPASENSEMTNGSSIDSPRLKSDSSDLTAGHKLEQKSEKPAIKPKPKPKPKPELCHPGMKLADIVNVPKKPAFKKGVSFCDNVTFFPVDIETDHVTGSTEDSRNRFQKRSLDFESVQKTYQSSESSGKLELERTGAVQKPSVTSPTSPTSPTTTCQISSGEMPTVHFKKESSPAPSPKPVRAALPLSSKKQPPPEKESKKETGGMKIGQSLFYSDVSSASVAPALPSKKLPPRPAKPRPSTTQGNIVLPNGIFYSAEFEASRTKPVPCRPAPPRPPSTPPLSPSLTTEDTDTVDYESMDVIKDIQRRITEIEKDLENLKNEEATFESQMSELTDEGETESIRDNLEFCRANATGLTDELNQLKENLVHLRPCPGPSSDKHRQSDPDGSTRTVAERPKAARRRLEEELRKKRLETRVKVVQEVIQTEHDYLQSLCLCLETFFNSDTPEVKCPLSVDLETLFGNIYEVVELSQKFINLLETNTLGKPFPEQLVGICFEELQEELKRVYAIYCRNHDGVLTLLEKYETMPEVQEYFATLLASMRVHATVFDVGSVLIKPVQRIMKYPLLLQELLKTTDEDHPDHRHLVAAVVAMRHVATYINEFKRRKDLVLKYKKPTDMSLRDMLSRLTVHSYRKKLGRLSMMVVGTLTVDENFSQQEVRFNALEECVPALVQSISQYLDFLQKSLASMELVANDTSDYYGNSRSEHEIDQLCRVSNCATHTMFSQFKSRVQSDILPPLNSLVTMLQGPQKLIRKRYHKLLDYENARLKQKNIRENEQIKPTNEEVQSCRNNYEALNLQLLEDLPKFCQISISVVTDCLRQFALIQEGFVGAAQKEFSKLLRLKGFSESSARGIVESFNIAHTEAVDLLSDMSFTPKSFNPLVEEKRKQRSLSISAKTSDAGSTEQTHDERATLCQTYSPDKLYIISEDFEGMQVMDLKLSRGVLVGVIKESDPMGNQDRFLVTNGPRRGFIPKRLLIPYTGCEEMPSMCSPNEMLASPSSTHSSSSSIVSDYAQHFRDDSLDLSTDQLYASVTDDSDYQDQDPGIGSEEVSAQDSPTSPSQEVFYRAEYPYVAEGDLEVSLSEGELVRVLQQQDVQGNGEWWLVARTNGSQGYVPATYLCDATLQDSQA